MDIIFSNPFCAEQISKYATVLTVPLHEQIQPINDWLVLTFYDDIIYVDNHPKNFPHLFAPTRKVAELLTNRKMFSSFLTENKMERYLPGPIKLGTYPYIIKEINSIGGGNGVYLVKNSEDFNRYTHILRSKKIDWITQDYVPGTHEYVAHSIVLNGVVLKSIIFTVKLPNKHYIKEGAMSTIAISYELPAALHHIYKLLNYTGFACANYKVGAHGFIKLFEINPRMGLSLALDNNSLIDMITYLRFNINSNYPTLK